MSDTPDKSAPHAAATPEFRAVQRWNMVWVVPLLALIIGGWLVYRNYSLKGPVARVKFLAAESIVAGTTEVRCRSVRVGIVKDIELAPDLSSVQVSVQMEPKGASLLREGCRFWVVKPRISGASVSGLNTLLEGAYIEMEPGTGKPGATTFDGLEEPPPTSRTVPGRRLVLKAEEAGSLTVGSAVFHRGVEVGRIESRTLAPNGGDVIYDVFVHEKFSNLITSNTRFWNSSGVDISAGATGVKVRAPSLSAMLSGGASFGIPYGLPQGTPVTADGAVFALFEDEDQARNTLFTPDSELLLMFEQSVLGLGQGSAVRFRGIHVGRVREVSFDLQKTRFDSRIPVLIEVDSTILCHGLNQDGSKTGTALWEAAVAKGLRASLKSESLLVPGLYVDLDCYPALPLTRVEHSGEHTILPTVTAGFAQLEERFTALMNKLDSLPLEDMMTKIGKAAEETTTTIAAARTSLTEINSAVAAIRKLADDPETRALPAELRATLEKLQKTVASIGPEGPVQGDLMRTLDELRASLRSIKSLSNTLEEKPSSILFGKDSSGNPTPRAPRGNR